MRQDLRMSRGDGGAVFVLVKEAPAQLGAANDEGGAPPPADGGPDDDDDREPLQAEALMPEAPAEPSAPAEPVAPLGERVEGPVAAAEGQGFDRTEGPVSGEFTEKGAAEGQGFDPTTAAAEGQGF